MFAPRPLDVLYLTNFSDYCFRTIPAVAQLADTIKIRLTVLHAYDPARETQSSAAEKVHSFFPEADRYLACNRLAAPGRMVDVALQHLQGWPVDLIVAPASDAVGFPRLGARSNRSRLIEQSGVPVWTFGRGITLTKLQQPVRNVACWLDYHSGKTGHLGYALEYASKMGAKLHLLSALPAIDEGMLSLGTRIDEGKPLAPEAAAAKILGLCTGFPIVPEVHVARSSGRSTLAQMLKGCDADTVFLHHQGSMLAEWLGLGLRSIDPLPCPSICTGDKVRGPVWNLEPGQAMRRMAEKRFHREQASPAIF
jgi:hypothetical protein